MTPITAHGGFGVCHDMPRSLDEVLARLRCIFALPETADLGQLFAELAKLRAWTIPGAAAPVGVDVGALCAALRALFNLPTLAAPDAIFTEADKLLAAVAAATPPPPVATPAAPAVAAARVEPPITPSPKETDDMPDLDIKALARRLKVKDTEEAVLLAVDQGQNAEQMLTSLLQALGVDDPQGAVTKIASLLKQAADLEQAMPELASLRDRVAKVDDQEANDEVDQAMSAHAMPASARVALLNLRRSDVKAFREAYPVPDARTAHLTRSFFTTPQTTPAHASAAVSSMLSRLSAGQHGVALAPPIAPPPMLGAGDAGVDLTKHPGANPIARAMSYLRAQPGGERLTFDELHAKSCDLVRSLRAAGRAV
jgi:hypothetical protein